MLIESRLETAREGFVVRVISPYSNTRIVVLIFHHVPLYLEWNFGTRDFSFPSLYRIGSLLNKIFIIGFGISRLGIKLEISLTSGFRNGNFDGIRMI